MYVEIRYLRCVWSTRSEVNWEEVCTDFYISKLFVVEDFTLN